MANVTEPCPKADTLANCGGAVSMGQIGNDVSFFTNYMHIYFSFFYFICLKFRLEMPALETNAPVVVRWVFLFPFSFFSLSNRERERIDRLFGFVHVSRNYDRSVHMYPCAHRHHLASMSLSIRVRMRPAHSKSHQDLTYDSSSEDTVQWWKRKNGR